jgi:hypothetical protein
MQNKDMIIRPTEFYEGIENLVTPELFFDLMGWPDSEFREELIKYRISPFHQLQSERLASLFGVSMYTFSRGSISLGEIALAKNHGLSEGQIMTVESACAGSRKTHSEVLMHKALSGIQKVWHNEKAMSSLKQLSMKYNGNKYINMLPIICKEDIGLISQNKLEISGELKTPCTKIVATCLNENMFKLTRDKDNISRNTRISSIIILMNKELMWKERPNDFISEGYRGAYVAGLYILAKWICEGRLSGIDEVNLGVIIHEIRKIITNHDNRKP